MTKKKILFILSIIISSVLILSFKSFENEASYKELVFSQNEKPDYLIKYGEYIFNRESCKNCHSLNVDEDPSLVSLDGLKDKYINMWHYMHLINPQLMVYESTMPSYSKLNNVELNATVFESELKFSKKNWNDLIKQADDFYSNLRKENTEYNEIAGDNNDINNKSEILALIAYLQSIPPSKEFIKKDSIQKVNIQIEEKKYEELLNDRNSTLYAEIASKESIEKGKIIYVENCSVCHGQKANGLIGPNLTDNYSIHGDSDFELAKVISYGGNPGKGMIGWNILLKPNEIGQVVAYIKSLKGTH